MDQVGKSRRKEDEEGTGPRLRDPLARCPNPPLASSFPASPRTKQKTRIRARVADPAPSFSPSICPYGSVLPHTSGPLSILPLHFTYSQREAQSEAQSFFRLPLLHFPYISPKHAGPGGNPHASLFPQFLGPAALFHLIQHAFIM